MGVVTEGGGRETLTDLLGKINSGEIGRWTEYCSLPDMGTYQRVGIVADEGGYGRMMAIVSIPRNFITFIDLDGSGMDISRKPRWKICEGRTDLTGGNRGEEYVFSWEISPTESDLVTRAAVVVFGEDPVVGSYVMMLRDGHCESFAASMSMVENGEWEW